MPRSKKKSIAESAESENFLDLISQDTYEDLMMAAAELSENYGRRGAAEAIAAIAVGLSRDLTIRQLDDDLLLAWHFLTPEAERVLQEHDQEQEIIQSLKLKKEE